MTIFSIKHRRPAYGFGLIELMIAIAIGLILSLALSYFFLGSQKSSRVHDDSSRMQENARNALDVMGRAIRQAGYNDNYLDFDNTAFKNVTGLSGIDNGSTSSDEITVRYQGQTGGEIDCAGTIRAAKVVLVSTFTVNNSLQLTCNNGSETVVVADNVEGMQIAYGLDTGVYPERSGIVSSPYSDLPADFRKVAVVKVVLTMRGTNADPANGGDGYVRQTYSASYTVRNQAL